MTEMTALVQFQPKGVSKLSLVEVEGVETVHTEFEGGGHVQQVCGAGAEFGSGLPGQLAGTLKNGIRQPTQVENAIAQVAFEGEQRRLGLYCRNFFAEDSQSHRIDYLQFSKSSHEVFR